MLETLTSREREIFDLLLEGISPKEIANRLNVSYSTIDFHRTKFYSKLGVHSIHELFAKYSANYNIPPPPPSELEPLMLENLTSREREIFNFLLEGVSPKEIANKLNVSYSTIDFHRTKLYNKLGVHSIQELFAKYSTNGKAPPVEQEAALPVSGIKMHKRFKLLLSVGIALLVLSVLFILILIKKSSAHSRPKGVMIPINLMSFRPVSDERDGGNSTSEISVTREEIDGVIIDSVLTLKTNLAKRENGNIIYAGAHTNSYYVIHQLRQANGIRFKARGDGKTWAAEFSTPETTAETNHAKYRYEFGTIRDQVIVVDIPYSSLFLPEWNNYSFDFKKETIRIFGIETTLSVQPYGSSFVQIFDFEIY